MVIDHSLHHFPVVPAGYAQLPGSISAFLPPLYTISVRTSQISPATEHSGQTAHERMELKDLGRQVLTALVVQGCDPRLG